MNLAKVITKIKKEYGKYGVTTFHVMWGYLLAIIYRLPHEVFYEGLRYTYNKQFGIKDNTAIDGVARGFMEYAVRDSMKSNPTATKETIRKNIAEEILSDGLDKLDSIEGMFPEIREACKREATKFVKKYA